MFKNITVTFIFFIFAATVQAAQIIYGSGNDGLTTHITDPDSNLSVLVIYDNNVNRIYGGDPRVKITELINWTNTAHRNSNTGVYLNVVGVVGLDIGQPSTGGAGPTQELLDMVTFNSAIMALRNKYKPTYTVYLTIKNSELCGIANLPDSWADFYKYGDTFDPLYSVSIVGVDCPADRFAHELGHNMGAGHGDMDPDGSGSPFTFSQGYGVQNIFADVMAYSNLYGVSYNLQLFSTPLKTCSGLPCGTRLSDASRGIKIVGQIQGYYSGCYPATQVNGEWVCNKPLGVVAANNYTKKGCAWQELNQTPTSRQLGLQCDGNPATLAIQTRSTNYPSDEWLRNYYIAIGFTPKKCNVSLSETGKQLYELVGIDCSNYKIQSACSTSYTLNIGQYCANSYCAESFGRSCDAAGGSTTYYGSPYQCQVTTKQKCSITPTEPTPPFFVPMAPTTTPTNINIGQSCRENYCAESFGRTCYAAGGSAVWVSGSFACQRK